jgi:hypothetical protein
MPFDPATYWTHNRVADYLYNRISFDTWSTETGADILDTLRSMGIAIRTQTFYEIRREVLDLPGRVDALGKVELGERAPRALYQDTPWELSTNFLYRVKVYGTDLVTGATVERWVSIASDTELERGTVESLAASYTQGGDPSGGVISKATKWESLLKRSDYEWPI